MGTANSTNENQIPGLQRSMTSSVRKNKKGGNHTKNNRNTIDLSLLQTVQKIQTIIKHNETYRKVLADWAHKIIEQDLIYTSELEDLELHSVYKGFLKRGKRHGPGSQLYINGNIYHGEFADGLEEGYGLVIQPFGKYEG